MHSHQLQCMLTLCVSCFYYFCLFSSSIQCKFIDLCICERWSTKHTISINSSTRSTQLTHTHNLYIFFIFRMYIGMFYISFRRLAVVDHRERERPFMHKEWLNCCCSYSSSTCTDITHEDRQTIVERYYCLSIAARFRCPGQLSLSLSLSGAGRLPFQHFVIWKQDSQFLSISTQASWALAGTRRQGMMVWIWRGTYLWWTVQPCALYWSFSLSQHWHSSASSPLALQSSLCKPTWR